MTQEAIQTRPDTRESAPRGGGVDHLFSPDELRVAKAMGVPEIRAFCGRWLPAIKGGFTTLRGDSDLRRSDCQRCVAVWHRGRDGASLQALAWKMGAS